MSDMMGMELDNRFFGGRQPLDTTGAANAVLTQALVDFLAARQDGTESITDVVRALMATVTALNAGVDQLRAGQTALVQTQRDLARYIAQALPPVVTVDAPNVTVTPEVTVPQGPTKIRKTVVRNRENLITEIIEERT